MYVPARSAAAMISSPFLARSCRPSSVKPTPSGSGGVVTAALLEPLAVAGATGSVGDAASGICRARSQPVGRERAVALPDVVQELVAEHSDARSY